jgi:hypothetical protein
MAKKISFENGNSPPEGGEECGDAPVLDIRVIWTDHKATALVEWSDENGPRRAYLPADKVQDTTCPVSELEAGIVYGVPWEDVIKPVLTPQVIAKVLREHEIWTYEDLLRNTTRAISALQEAMSADLSALLAATTQYLEEVTK